MNELINIWNRIFYWTLLILYSVLGMSFSSLHHNNSFFSRYSRKEVNKRWMKGCVSYKWKVWMMCIFLCKESIILDSKQLAMFRTSTAPSGKNGALRCDCFLLFELFGVCRYRCHCQPANYFSLIALFTYSLCHLRHIRSPWETVVSTETRPRNRLTSDSRSNYRLIAHFSSSPRPVTTAHQRTMDTCIQLFIYSLLKLGHESRSDQVSGLRRTMLTALGERFTVDQIDSLTATPAIPSGNKERQRSFH